MNRPVADRIGRSSVAAHGWAPLSVELTAAQHGGKAANLSRMMRARMPVPPGGVLGIDAVREFLVQTRLDARIAALPRLSPQTEPAAFFAVAADMRGRFESSSWPASLAAILDRWEAHAMPGSVWAVRSSAVGEDGATSSYAGLMDSVLGVSTRAGLEAAIKQVWASRWSARVLAYEQAHGPLGAIAVIVQRQIDPLIAGVLFTRDPAPDHPDEMLCEYCGGLADRLVAGEIDPVRIRIDRRRLMITDCVAQPGVPNPSARAIRDLARTALEVERLFCGPQDIEFAIDRAGKVWIVQARPVTALTPSRGRRVVWSNANVNENFPDPISPLLYSIVAPGYTAYFGNLGRAFGLSSERRHRMRSDLDSIVGVHGGRLYYNLTAIHAVLRAAPFGERLCAWFDDFTGASDPARPNRGPQRAFVRSLRDAAELVWIAARTSWQYLFIERRIREFEACIDAFAQASTPARLATMNTAALRDLLGEFIDIRMRRWTHASLADAAAMMCYGALKALVQKIAGSADAAGLHNDLLKGLSGLKSAEPVEALWRLARYVRGDSELARLFAENEAAQVLERIRADSRFAEFRRRFDAYLDAWGYRCSGELMLTVPSFQERPAELLEIVRCYAQQSHDAPNAKLADQRVEREAVTQELLKSARKHRVFGKWPWPSFATLLAPVIAATQASIGLRERARLKQALLYSRLRQVALAIGAKLVQQGRLAVPDDVFFLSRAEIDELLGGHAMFPEATRALVELRKKAHAPFGQLRPDDVLVANQGEYPAVQADTRARQSDGTRLHGVSVCGGTVVGSAKVLTHVAQTRYLRKGDVLVTRQTDPGWAPAFVLIGGLVLERGGMLSHGAILAREYGIPTLVGVHEATRCIADGRRVCVDAEAGEVRLLDA